MDPIIAILLTLLFLYSGCNVTITSYGGDGKAGELFLEGHELAEQGRFEEAIAKYADAIRSDPTNASAYNFRALAYNKLGQYVQGIQDLDKAIRLDPRMAEAYYKLLASQS